MKKIAFFVGSMNRGGTERVVLNLATYFRSIGVETCIITAWQKENEYVVPDEIPRYNVALTKEEWTKNKIKNALLRNAKRDNFIRTFAPDIIVSFIKENNFKAILTGTRCHVPVVVSVRSDPMAEYSKWWERWLMRFLFRKAAGIVLQTKEMKNFFPRKLQSKSTILPNSINPLFLKEVYNGPREKRIVMVGRLDENKNQMLLLSAFSDLKEEYPEWECVCYGEGTNRENLENAISANGMEKCFRLAGAIPDIHNEIVKASIFVLASRFEGMPNALLEAMASGLAVISTDCEGGGPGEVIKSMENGILIPIDDREALKEKLKLLMSDDELCVSLGKAARKTAETMHPDRVNLLWKNYLESILK